MPWAAFTQTSPRAFAQLASFSVRQPVRVNFVVHLFAIVLLAVDVALIVSSSYTAVRAFFSQQRFGMYFSSFCLIVRDKHSWTKKIILADCFVHTSAPHGQCRSPQVEATGKHACRTAASGARRQLRSFASPRKQACTRVFAPLLAIIIVCEISLKQKV